MHAKHLDRKFPPIDRMNAVTTSATTHNIGAESQTVELNPGLAWKSASSGRFGRTLECGGLTPPSIKLE